MQIVTGFRRCAGKCFWAHVLVGEERSESVLTLSLELLRSQIAFLIQQICRNSYHAANGSTEEWETIYPFRRSRRWWLPSDDIERHRWNGIGDCVLRGIIDVGKTTHKAVHCFGAWNNLLSNFRMEKNCAVWDCLAELQLYDWLPNLNSLEPAVEGTFKMVYREYKKPISKIVRCKILN